jgi:hypothetical protein
MILNGRKRSAKSLIFNIVVLACTAIAIGVAAGWAMRPSHSNPVGFVVRSGDKLTLNGQTFRFAGANLYWGAMDQSGRPALNYPTPFRVEAGLRAVADMGGTVVRCMTCGISTGNPLSVEPRLGQFNETALRHVDYFFAQAQKYHMRVIVPLTGNATSYEGGYCNFTNWLGLSRPSNCPSPAALTAFYTSPQAIASFEKYITTLMNHVNYYTGVPNKDNPTIMAWETGNELRYGLGGAAEFTRWTAGISAYLKSLAPHQLVMDGALSLDASDLALRDVDIQDQHLYPISAGKLDHLAARVARAGQAFVLGEYGWNTQALPPSLADILRTRTVSGDLYWDLLPQNDLFGFVEHFDGLQVHFPGDTSAVGPAGAVPARASVGDAPLVADLRRHAYAMSGIPVPSYPVPWAPAITGVEQATSATEGTGNLVEWRGSPGAASYVVRRSAQGPDGPWMTVGVVSAAASEAPFLDRKAAPGRRLWYQVTAVNATGALGPPSIPYKSAGHTHDDNFAGFGQSAGHSAGVTIDTSSARRYGGDGSRAKFPPGQAAQSVTWHVSGLTAVETLAYYVGGTPTRISFLLSVNGTKWISVPATDVQANTLPGSSQLDHPCYIYTIHDLQQILAEANYVRVQRPANASGIAELGEARIMRP